MQAGAIGTQNYFEQYNFLPQSTFRYNGFRIGAGFSGLIPYSGTRWAVKIQHDGYFGDFDSGNISFPFDATRRMVLPSLRTNNFKYYSPSIKIEIAQAYIERFFRQIRQISYKKRGISINNSEIKKND